VTGRAIWGFAAATIAATSVASDLIAQRATAQPRNERVWTGTIDDREAALNLHDETPIHRPVRYFHDINVSFRFVSQDDPDRPGRTRWTSRRMSWRALATSSSSITGVNCIGHGNIELGPSDVYDGVTPAQRAQMNIPCKSWDKVTNWALIRLPHPSVPMPRIQMDMTTCEPTRRWTVGGVRYTLSVSGIYLSSLENFRINTDPRMPEVKGEVEDSAATWEAQIKLSRGYCTGGPNFDSSRVTGTGAAFKPDFRGMYGGQLDVSVKTSCGVEQKIEQVGADDPGKSAIQAEIATHNLPSPFDADDLKRIACQESAQRQFLDDGTPNWADRSANGRLIRHGGGDVGIMQICWQRTNRVIWDWKHNIETGYNRLMDALRQARRMPNRVRTHVVRGRPGQTGGGPFPQATDFTDEQLRMEAIQRYNAYNFDFGYWQWDDELKEWIANPQMPNPVRAHRATTPNVENPYADNVADCSPLCPVHCAAQ
jgi:hypothetical protein